MRERLTAIIAIILLLLLIAASYWPLLANCDTSRVKNLRISSLLKQLLLRLMKTALLKIAYRLKNFGIFPMIPSLWLNPRLQPSLLMNRLHTPKL